MWIITRYPFMGILEGRGCGGRKRAASYKVKCSGVYFPGVAVRETGLMVKLRNSDAFPIADTAFFCYS